MSTSGWSLHPGVSTPGMELGDGLTKCAQEENVSIHLISMCFLPDTFQVAHIVLNKRVPLPEELMGVILWVALCPARCMC